MNKLPPVSADQPAEALAQLPGAKRSGAFSDSLEALMNAAIGLVVSILLTWLWLGFSPVQSVGITAVFFVVSTFRAYAIRRFFRWLS